MVGVILDLFPGLRQCAFRVSSPPTHQYNCIALAVGDETRWWWPEELAANVAVHWPAGAPRVETVPAFVAAFATLGFVPCEDEGFEEGFERVALFALADGTPTHAARQVSAEWWVSKLGRLEDILHPLHALSGAEYGTVVQILKRPVLKD
jgi:hypothetical protein